MYKRVILYIALIIFSALNLSAQDEWVVPEDKKVKLSPFEFNDSTKSIGAEIFSNNCKSCHGTPGMNNFQALNPSPGDPASVDFQENTDGELYHKIREGRVLMPSFKNSLTPDQVWSVISYFRSFNKDYVQEVAKEVERGTYDGDVFIKITYLEHEKKLEAQVIGTKDGKSKNIEGAEINLAVKRMFGDLTIDEPKETNKNGKALFDLNKQLPGDNNGDITLIAKLTDQDAFGIIETDTTLAIGSLNTNGSLVAERAIFNKMRMAPIWLLLTYFLGVLAVWGTLFFILLQLRKIYFIGKK